MMNTMNPLTPFPNAFSQADLPSLLAGFKAGLTMGGNGVNGLNGLNPGVGNPFGNDLFTGNPFGAGNELAGLFNPMMGLGQMGQASPQELQAVLMLLEALLANAQAQGNQGPLGGARGPWQPPGGPFGGPQPGGPFGTGGPGQMGQQRPGGRGGVVDLKKGDTFTTPSGSTISWQEDEVKIHETGQGAGAGAGAANGGGPGGPGGPGGDRQFALIIASAAAAAASSGGADGTGAASASASASADTALQSALGSLGPMLSGPAGAASSSAAAQNQPRDWKVWGDPHIQHPDGSKSDFDRPNALFTLQDGTRVMMMAKTPGSVVEQVRIFLPDSPVNFDGVDPAQTSVMRDNNGKFESAGSADQFLQGGFR